VTEKDFYPLSRIDDIFDQKSKVKLPLR